MIVLDFAWRGVAAIGIAGGLALAAYVAATRACGRRGLLLRAVAAVIALLWVATVLFHLLAALRLFALVPGVACAVLLAGLAARAAGGPRALGRALRRDGDALRRIASKVRTSPHRFWILAFALLASPGLLRAIAIPPLGWDTLTYHGVKAAMWVQNGGVDSMVGTGPWAYYRNMLAGGEVFTAWAMLPMRADTLTGIVEVAQWLALALASLALARELRAREPYGSAAAGAVLAVPTLFVLPGSGYVEPGMLLALVGSLALGLRGLRGRPALLLLAGGGFGVSAAAKLPMVPLCGLLLALFVLFAFARGNARRRVLAVAGIAAFLAALGPWLWLSYSRTGAIFSPLPIRIGELVLGHAPPEVAWMLSRPLPAMDWLAREGKVLLRVFHAPIFRSESPGMVSLAALALAPFGFVRLARRERSAAVALGSALVVSAALYLSPGLAPVRVYWTFSSSRFLLPFFALAVLVAVSGLRSGSRAALFVLRAFALYALAGHLGWGFGRASWLGAAAAAGIVASLAAAFGFRRRGRLAVRLAVTVAALVCLGVARDALRHDALANDFMIHRDVRAWAGAVPLVDRPGEPRVVAVTSGPKRSLDNWFAYPFFGSRLQNTVVYVPPSREGGIDETANFDDWLPRLRDRGVTEVMSFEPASVELGWMEARPDRFERLSGDGAGWGLYRVRGGGATLSSPRDSRGS
jgi:hypothetical protein